MGTILKAAVLAVIGLAVMLVVVAIAVGDDGGSTPPVTAPTEAEQGQDPYDHYLTIAPPDAIELTREDAQTRALLGCGQPWAPGTIDAALATAYADLCPD